MVWPHSKIWFESLSFACSPRVCMGSPGTPWSILPTVQRHAFNWLSLIGGSKLAICVNVGVIGCGYRMDGYTGIGAASQQVGGGGELRDGIKGKHKISKDVFEPRIMEIFSNGLPE